MTTPYRSSIWTSYRAAIWSAAVEYEWLPSELVLLPIPDIFDAPDRFDRVALGEEMVRSVSVSAQSSYAVLFSTAAGSQDRDHVTIINVDRSSQDYLSYRTQALRETLVESVLVAPDDSYAIAVLIPGAQSQVAGAFAVIPVSEDLAVRLEPTRAPPRLLRNAISLFRLPVS